MQIIAIEGEYRHLIMILPRASTHLNPALILCDIYKSEYEELIYKCLHLKKFKISRKYRNIHFTVN